MNGAALIAAIRTATMVPESQVSDNDVLNWINEGYYRIAASRPWPWLEGLTYLYTAIGSPAYPLTSIGTNLRRIVAIYDSEGRYRLRQYDPATAFDMFGDYSFIEQASTITEPIASAGATSMTLASAALYTTLAGHSPSATEPIYLRFTLDGEIVKCTNFAGNVATIARGQYNTTATTHADNEAVAYAPVDRLGAPTGFFIWNSSLYLMPVPDDVGALRIFYHKAPTAITLGGAPEFDVTFHHALAHYGEFRMWQREEDLDKATASYAHYKDIADEMRDWYRQRVDDSPWQIGAGIGSGVLTNTPFLDGL